MLQQAGLTAYVWCLVQHVTSAAVEGRKEGRAACLESVLQKPDAHHLLERKVEWHGRVRTCRHACHHVWSPRRIKAKCQRVKAISRHSSVCACAFRFQRYAPLQTLKRRRACIHKGVQSHRCVCTYFRACGQSGLNRIPVEARTHQLAWSINV